ncbi:MAG TPA: hypothetical protein PL001_11020 [Candidatus Kryptobacter bacterium]|nr:MAG: hypothetical protein B7Z63_03115 [Ignavibacteriae bacterium 37-53-5]HQT92544.1 hypothetical protein [Candidatus Kryptobacter bacterium]
MAERKKFLLRISEDLYAALEKWAADDLRSVNAQVEYLLTEAARKTGRVKPASVSKENPDAATTDGAEN